MKTAKLLDRALNRLVLLALITLLFGTFGVNAAIEQTFDVLQIGATTYRNVTVTTKSTDYVFILHSKGMTNLKIADLPTDIRTKLGYVDPPPAQVKSNTPAWARQAMSKIQVPLVQQAEQQLLDWSHGVVVGTGLRLPELSQDMLLIAAAALLALYLFHCYCCLLICAKSGSPPGILIWVPLLQLFPLLKAAAMPPWWFVVFLLPGLNLIAHIVLCIKLTESRNKTLLVALLLIFPLSSPLAAAYLAFSGGKKRKKDDRRIEIMTLEAA